MSGYWQVVIPEQTSNLILDSSFEFGTLATYWTAGGGGGTGTTALSTAKAARGCYSVLCTGGSLGAIVYQSITTAATTYTLTCLLQRADGTAVTGADVQAIIDGSGVAFDSITAVGGGWYYCQKSASETAAAHDTGLSIAAGVTLYLDCVQFEAKAYPTTYCDGDQPGCTWSGGAHTSTSRRSAQYRGGGRVRDFLTDYGVGVVAMEGWGVPPVNAAVTEYAMLPGGLVQGQKVGPRQWQLVFEAAAPALGSIHTARDYLVEAFKPDLVSPPQPVRLRYTGATATLEIDAWYVGGLEGSLVGEDGVAEQPVARLLSEDPFWYSVINGASTLTTSRSLTPYFGVKRTSDATATSNWTALSTGINDVVNAFTKNPLSNDVYVCGVFTTAAGLNAPYFMRLNSSGGLVTVSTAMKASPLALCPYTSQDVIVGGGFTSAGVANTQAICRYDASSTAFVAISTGIDGEVYALARGIDGRVYIGGKFVDHGDANGDYVTAWGTSSGWISLGAGMSTSVRALAVGLEGTLYAGGAFVSAGGTAVNGIARYDGTTWAAMGEGTSSGATVYALAVGPDGTLYAGGNFTQMDNLTVNYIAAWNGTKWRALGSGLDYAVYNLAVDRSGNLWADGFQWTPSGVTLRAFGIWNGSAWCPGDAELSTSGNWRLYADGDDIYGGFNVWPAADPTTTTSAITTVTNGGSSSAYPKIIVSRSGGSSLTLTYLENVTTKQKIYLNYSLLDGETLTIDLDYRPDPTAPASKLAGRKRITSDIFGDVIGRSLLAGSDFAAFCLAPGSNTITVYACATDTPTVTCYCTYRVPYWSPDGGV